jgi:HEAT repeat protein
MSTCANAFIAISLSLLSASDTRVPTSTSELIAELSRVLTSPALEREKIVAAETIETLGPDARSAVPALIAAMGDPSLSVRISVCSALAAIGPEARPAVPALATALADKAGIAPSRLTYNYEVGPSLRGSSATALASVGRDAAAATPALIDAMRVDDSPTRHQQYVDALSAIGPEAIRPLIKALRDPGIHLRIGAVRSLAGMGEELAEMLPELVLELANDAEYQSSYALGVRTIADDVAGILSDLGQRSIPVLRTTVRDPKLPLEVRARAAVILSRLQAEDAVLALPSLIEALTDSRLRGIAAEALGELGGRARNAIGPLEALANGQGRFRFRASASLARIDHANRAVGEALNQLQAAIMHDTPRERALAVGELGMFGERSIPLLVLAVRDTDPLVKAAAALRLGRIGPPARAAIPVLLANLRPADPYDPLPGNVVRALGQIGLKRSDAAETMPVLLAMLENDFGGDVATLIGQVGSDFVRPLGDLLADEHKNRIVRSFAARALGRIGAEAKPTVPALIALLDDSNALAEQRPEIIQAMGRIGPNARAAVPALIPLLKSDFEVTAIALVGIGPPAVDGLAAAVRSTDRELKVAAVRVLAKLGRIGAPATSLMIEVAMEGDRDLRVNAIVCLGALGHDAILAGPSLVRCMVDPSQRIRAAACAALGKLGPLSTLSVTALGKALHDDALAVRLQAAVALGQSAPPGAPALALLETAAKVEAYETVRAAIKNARKAIQRRVKRET